MNPLLLLLFLTLTSCTSRDPRDIDIGGDPVMAARMKQPEK